MSDDLSGVVVRQKRGFAIMDPEKHRAICSKGGVMAHLKGTAHEFTAEEARTAGKKGGLAKGTPRRKPAA